MNGVASSNIVRQLLLGVSKRYWEAGAAAVLYPLSLLWSYGIFASVSTLVIVAMVGGIMVTLAPGILVYLGGGLGMAMSAIRSCRMWPRLGASELLGGETGQLFLGAFEVAVVSAVTYFTAAEMVQ